MKPRTSRGAWLAALALSAGGCGSEDTPPGSGDAPGSSAGAGGGNGDPAPNEPGTTLTLALASDVADPLFTRVQAAEALDASQLLAQHALPFQAELGYDPRSALGLGAIELAFGLNAAELERLGQNGFVIVPRREYPSFPYAYMDVYAADLPVYVSADMVLEAVHRSYDEILKQLEMFDLSLRVERLLVAMRTRLASGEVSLPEGAPRDVDLYLSVALGLLTARSVQPVTDLEASSVSELVSRAAAARGSETVELFGVAREIDFSQFKPRGHYTETEELQRYFRAMIWLGRTDLRLIEAMDDGRQVFRRRQLETALGLRALLDTASQEDYRVIDHTIGVFVGEHDYMTVPELDELLSDLGSSPEAGLGERSDQVVAQAIVDGQYGAQRIASQIVRKAPGAGETLPLSASFALFGQRYTVDSHVFSSVVYDRVATRVLPDPLDAAFAALGNDQAAALLEPQLTRDRYAGALGAMRTLVDAHPSEYWQSSLYTSWLGALRALSPRAAGAAPGSAAPTEEGLPAVARSESWGRRLLNTQLASWAELRHDTILYAKQSYTTGSVCEFPDAYVEPYPEFFHGLVRYAELGQSVVDELGLDASEPLLERVSQYFGSLARITGILAEMAEAQRSGMPHSPEDVAFINQAVRIEGGGSGPPMQTGWYKDLYFDPYGALDLDPTIADVHTDPGGDTPIARQASVLHVGTGQPRALVVTIDTCAGPRAYAGAVFAYHEQQQPGLERLDDEQWLEQLQSSGAPDVPWLEPVLAPR